MDYWSQNIAGYLEQYSVAAIALKEMEQIDRFSRTVADTALRSFAETGYQRAVLSGITEAHTAEICARAKLSTELSGWNLINKFDATRDILRAQEVSHLHLSMSSSIIENEAKRIAEFAQTCALHSSLELYRTPVEPFTDKLLHLQTLDTINSHAYLNSFIQTSAISDLIANSMRVDRQLQEATQHFAQSMVPTFSDLYDYRQFLDAAGLRLSHWPHQRLLSRGEKRRRLRAKIKSNAEPKHVKKGKSIIHRYELTLRDILDGAMADAYGEDWAVIRLPLCNCSDLLGKWKKRGGAILDHADYTHYERIMSNPEHFEAVFEGGFDDQNNLAELIQRAGKLRAALLHCHPFSQEDLRDMRLTWITIEKGLLALIPDYEFET